MKIKLHLLVFFALLLVVALPALAQDEGLPNPDFNGYPGQDVNAYDDKPLIFEHDLKNPRIIRDTTATRPTPSSSARPKSSASSESKKPKEDDPLNFNFLYYIIQKFKTSDLIEQ